MTTTKDQARVISPGVEMGDMLRGQVEMLPSMEEVEFVVGRLSLEDLRTFTCGVMDCTIASAHRGTLDVDMVRAVNGWFGTMEEILDAGDSIDELLGRRDDIGEYLPAERPALRDPGPQEG